MNHILRSVAFLVFLAFASELANARSLYDAFSQAKALWLTRLRSAEANSDSDRKYRRLAKVVGNDPLPFGMKQNLPTIEALEDTAFKQKLTPRRMPIEELFVDL